MTNLQILNVVYKSFHEFEWSIFICEDRPDGSITGRCLYSLIEIRHKLTRRFYRGDQDVGIIHV